MVLKQSEISFVHLNRNESKMLDYPKFPTALYFSSDYINSVFFAVAALLLDNFKKSVSIFYNSFFEEQNPVLISICCKVVRVFL
jgi:hypothetical protein